MKWTWQSNGVNLNWVVGGLRVKYWQLSATEDVCMDELRTIHFKFLAKNKLSFYTDSAITKINKNITILCLKFANLQVEFSITYKLFYSITYKQPTGYWAFDAVLFCVYSYFYCLDLDWLSAMLHARDLTHIFIRSTSVLPEIIFKKTDFKILTCNYTKLRIT